MRDYLRKLLPRLYALRTIDQANKLTDKQAGELFDAIEDECNRKEWERLKPEVKERIIEEAVKTEKDFFGINVFFVRSALQKFWNTHGGRILELEAQQKDGIEIVQRSPEELKRIDIIANGYLEQIKNGFNVREVPQLSRQEIEEEGQDRPKLPTYISDDRYILEQANRLNEGRRKIIKERHPELSDEEIEKYIDKL